MPARVEPFAFRAGLRERARSQEQPALHLRPGARERCRPDSGQGRVPPLPGRPGEGSLRDSGPFHSLVQICLSELRTDITRLLESGWAEPERKRACELAQVLHQACQQQSLRRLAAATRSVAMLVGLPREEAIPLYVELRRQFKALLLLAEACLLKRTYAPARA